MRKSHVCPKCRHNKILIIEEVADKGEMSRDLKPMHIAIAFTGIGLFGNEKREAAGKLGAAVCKACGYTELHTTDPALIPIDGRYVREVTGPEPTPYR